VAAETIAILSPGEMGSAVGRALRGRRLRVVTCLRGRSARSAERAAAAGIEAVADDVALVRQADVLLSILVPSEALPLAERVAAALRATGRSLLYVDCNAVAPETARRVGAVVTGAGARFVDAGIIGGPPAAGRDGPRFYASGEDAAAFARAVSGALDVRVIGGAVGQASGLKMCYAALTKGLTALAVELTTASQALGLASPLRAELAASQPGLLAWIERQAPGMPPKAHRWVGEMEEIAATFAALGLTPKLFEGAADLYRFVQAALPNGEPPGERTLDALTERLASALPGGQA
jgi:3-hydroxyisobutyrate dehydrogenase-like beta-hydroxyacid dehydrogenase